MTEPHSIEPPVSVRHGDGRVMPFEADKICQAIFQATEAIGQSNAFLAREMTDGVVHFLAQEHSAGTPSTAQVAELVMKVLRELGQPGLAQAFAQARAMSKTKGAVGRPEEAIASVAVPLSVDRSPEQFVDDCRRLFSLHAVFSADLTAAQNEGFLSLAGLEHPGQLEGGLLSWVASEEGTLLPAILEARHRFGGFIVLDGPEYSLGNSPARIRSFVEQLRQGLEATGLKAIVNLNAAEPPPWAQPPGPGPLFPVGATPSHSAADADSLSLLVELLQTLDGVRIDWHLGERDFQKDDTGLTLALPKACSQVNFVFDRARVPLALAEAMDRRHPAVLQLAGLNLARLADMSGVDGNLDQFLQKLLHLAQMALSAGVQKRRFLRQLTQRRGGQVEDLRRGFFLDRARLSVVPVGLPAVVQRFTGEAITGKQGLVVARRIIERLGQCLGEAGRSLNLDGVLDSPWWTQPRPGVGSMFAQPHLAGMTAADFAASAEDQLRSAGSLHQLFGTGTATLLVPADLAGNCERFTQLLRLAWKKTAVIRMRRA